MPTYAIEIKAELLNIASLNPVEDIMWKMDVESESGEIRENITVDPRDELELDGSRGTAHFVMKWSKQDSHQAYIKVIELTKKTLNKGKKKKDSNEGKSETTFGLYNDSNNWVTMLLIECRGLKPNKIKLSNEDFNIISDSGTVFDASEVEYEEEREGFCWTDFDEKLDDCVGINNLQARIVDY